MKTKQKGKNKFLLYSWYLNSNILHILGIVNSYIYGISMGEWSNWIYINLFSIFRENRYFLCFVAFSFIYFTLFLYKSIMSMCASMRIIVFICPKYVHIGNSENLSIEFELFAPYTIVLFFQRNDPVYYDYELISTTKQTLKLIQFNTLDVWIWKGIQDFGFWKRGILFYSLHTVKTQREREKEHCRIL